MCFSSARAIYGRGGFVHAFDPVSLWFQADVYGQWITAEQTAQRFVCHLDGVTVSCFFQCVFPCLP